MGTSSPSADGARCVEAFCETFCETLKPTGREDNISIPAKSASHTTSIQSNRACVSVWGNQKVTLRARNLGASRGVQSQGVPANGTLLFDFEPSGQSRQSELQRVAATAKHGKCGTVTLRRFVGVFLPRANIGTKAWKVAMAVAPAWRAWKQRRFRSG